MQDQIRAEMRAVSSRVDRDDWTERLAAADTCVAPVLTVPEAIADERSSPPAATSSTAVHPEQGTFRQVGPVFAGMERPDAAYVARDATITDTDTVLERRWDCPPTRSGSCTKPG